MTDEDAQPEGTEAARADGAADGASRGPGAPDAAPDERDDPADGRGGADAGGGDAPEGVADLPERVAEHDDRLATAVSALVRDLEAAREERNDLAERVESLEDDLEERTEALQRARAEFQNYKKRQEKRREQLEETATEDLVERLLDVRDNLVRALEAEGDEDDLREGVEATLRRFDQVLDAESVETIEPDPGTDVDPHRHEVLMRVDSEEPADTVADVYRPGYEMGEKVLRPAQVTVSEDG